MRATVNGQVRDLDDAATCVDVIIDLGRDPDRPGAAVAVNGELVPRGRWPRTPIREGDRIDVLEAAQGG